MINRITGIKVFKIMGKFKFSDLYQKISFELLNLPDLEILKIHDFTGVEVPLKKGKMPNLKAISFVNTPVENGVLESINETFPYLENFSFRRKPFKREILEKIIREVSILKNLKMLDIGFYNWQSFCPSEISYLKDSLPNSNLLSTNRFRSPPSKAIYEYGPDYDKEVFHEIGELVGMESCSFKNVRPLEKGGNRDMHELRENCMVRGLLNIDDFSEYWVITDIQFRELLLTSDVCRALSNFPYIEKITLSNVILENEGDFRGLISNPRGMLTEITLFNIQMTYETFKSIIENKNLEKLILHGCDYSYLLEKASRSLYLSSLVRINIDEVRNIGRKLFNILLKIPRIKELEINNPDEGLKRYVVETGSYYNEKKERILIKFS